MTSALALAPKDSLETVACYACGSLPCAPFIEAEDDLGGRPGRFRFVTCAKCGLVYQNPRLPLEAIKAWYDDEYIRENSVIDRDNPFSAQEAKSMGYDVGRLRLNLPYWRLVPDGCDARQGKATASHIPIRRPQGLLAAGCPRRS